MTTTMTPPQEEGRELGYLLTAYLFENLSEEGYREVEDLLASDPDAKAELEELRDTLGLVEESLKATGGAKPGAYSFENSRMERVLAASRKRPVFQVTRRRLVLGMAAILLGFVSLCSLFILQMGGRAPAGNEMTADAPASSAARRSRTLRVETGLSQPRHGMAMPATEEGESRRGLPAATPQAGKERAAGEMDSVIIATGGGAAGAYRRRDGRARVIRESASNEEIKALEENTEREYAETPPEEEMEELVEERQVIRPALDKAASKNPELAGELNELQKISEKKKFARIQPPRAAEKARPSRDKDLRSLQRQTQSASRRPEKRAPAKPREGEVKVSKRKKVEGNTFFAEKPGAAAGSRIIDPIGIAGSSGKFKDGRPDESSERKILKQEEAAPAHHDIYSIEGIAAAQQGKNSAIGAGGTAAGKSANRANDQQKESDSSELFFDDASFDDETPQEDNKNADVGFTDGDFSLEDETEDENNGVVEQIAGEGGRFRSSAYQARVPTNGNFRLNITRQDGLLIPLGNDAGLDNPRQQAQQVEVQTASESIEDAVFPDLAQQQDQGLEKDLLVVNEDTLNTFSYYRKLDKRLSFQQFRSRALSIPPPAIGDEGLGEKGFRKKYGVNPFVATSRDHLSTFGMDVDNASWGRGREVLRGGRLPTPDVVRVEEFVNNFSDERPGNPDSVFTVFTEGGPSPFGGSELELLQITIKSRDLLPEERKNAVLTFAVDTSGSMASDGRIELLQESLKALVANLGANDRVAIVAFSTNAFVVLPHTSARQRTHIEAAIDSLSPDGGTNVEAGIDLAYRLAGESHDHRAANRVLLCSDGVANLGAKGPEAILERIRRFAEGNLVSLFTYAFGTGGRQAVQGDRMLQRLADEGDGRYQYVDSSQSGRDLFSLPDQLQFLASDAKIQVDFNPEVISHYRLLGYEKRDIADVDFRNDKIDAGEVGPGSTVTAIYEIKRARPIGSLGRIHLRYRDETSRRFEEFDFDLPTGVLAGRLADTTDRFRFIAAISEFAEILRQSYYARDASYGAVLQLMASNSTDYRARTDWREARELIGIAQGLSAVEALDALEAQELFSPSAWSDGN